MWREGTLLPFVRLSLSWDMSVMLNEESLLFRKGRMNAQNSRMVVIFLFTKIVCIFRFIVPFDSVSENVQ